MGVYNVLLWNEERDRKRGFHESIIEIVAAHAHCLEDAGIDRVIHCCTFSLLLHGVRRKSSLDPLVIRFQSENEIKVGRNMSFLNPLRR